MLIGIAQHQLDLLVRPDHEHGAHGGVRGRGAAFGSVAGVRRQHVIQLGDLEFRVADHGVVHLVALRFFDVRGPLAVAAHRVHAQPDDLAIALLEFRLQPGHVAQFGGAHRRKVLGMREQDGPAVADPFVEVDRALRSFGREIGSFVVDAQHGLSPGVVLSRGRPQEFHPFGLPSRQQCKKREFPIWTCVA